MVVDKDAKDHLKQIILEECKVMINRIVSKSAEKVANRFCGSQSQSNGELTQKINYIQFNDRKSNFTWTST